MRFLSVGVVNAFACLMMAVNNLHIRGWMWVPAGVWMLVAFVAGALPGMWMDARRPDLLCMPYVLALVVIPLAVYLGGFVLLGGKL